MKPIENPYAKKSQAPAARGPTTNPTTTGRADSVPTSFQNYTASSIPAGSTEAAKRKFPAPSLPAPVAATFSQAFGAIEDTEIYRDQLLWQQQRQQPPPGKQQQQQQPMNTDEYRARAEQRAFDQNDAATLMTTSTTAAANRTTATTPPPPPIMSDRDHHVLLQQPHVLYVSVKQRGNGVLQYIRNVPMQYQTMVPDYIFSSTSCALFLSIKYHNLYPEYIFRRIAALRNDFALRILLVLVDCEDNAAVLLQLNKTAVTQNFTLILAWSEEEAARYLETYKALHGKDASSIQKTKEQTHFADQVTDFLTTCKGINKTDAAAVLTQFGSIRAAMAATPDELGLIGGLGEVKVKRLHDAFHKPFSRNAARLRAKQRREAEAKQEMQRKSPRLADDDVDEEEIDAINDARMEEPDRMLPSTTRTENIS